METVSAGQWVTKTQLCQTAHFNAQQTIEDAQKLNAINWYCCILTKLGL